MATSSQEELELTGAEEQSSPVPASEKQEQAPTPSKQDKPATKPTSKKEAGNRQETFDSMSAIIARIQEREQQIAEIKRSSAKQIKEIQALINADRAIMKRLLGQAHKYIAPVMKNRQTAKPAARYRDPESGKTWSGRGKPPQWIAGKNKDDFLIK